MPPFGVLPDLNLSTAAQTPAWPLGAGELKLTCRFRHGQGRQAPDARRASDKAKLRFTPSQRL
jgi:hypothetical protein